MITAIKSFIEEYNLIPDESSIVVGLSGGPDSVFLLHFLVDELKEKKLRLIAAHLDHQWRPESASDLQFCKQLCHDLNVPFESATAAQLGLDLKATGSLEERGRIMRRVFLEAMQREHKADLIALAHHADDQEETFFIRLIRGTTLSGLVGMQPKSGPYIRPLLSVFKRDILADLHAHHREYLIDPSNERPEFLRNRIRQTVIPALRACDERFDHNFLATRASLQEAEYVLHMFTVGMFDDLAQKREEGWHLDTAKLLRLIPYVRNRVIMYWLIQEHIRFTPREQFFAEIVRFLQQPGSKDHMLGTNWGIRKKKNHVYLYRITPNT